MKRVLIIGENSYIGKSFEAFFKDEYEMKTISSRGDSWKNVSFEGFDSVLHCAGIAHVSRRAEMKFLYYAVNCDLAVSIAKKALNDGVKQFIYLSSILVYGDSATEIDMNTIPAPAEDDFYGGSKLKAEIELKKIAGDNFNLCIIRPPMVYGNRCKGNFPKLLKLSRLSPVFPDYPNRRSIIYIENLVRFIGAVISQNSSGIFLPRNKENVSTTEIVKCAAEMYGKKIYTTKLFNPIISFLIKNVGLVKKMFGDLVYIKGEADDFSYCAVDFKSSIFACGDNETI